MYFFVKALYPRPTFHLNMRDEEREIMRRHDTPLITISSSTSQGT